MLTEIEGKLVKKAPGAVFLKTGPITWELKVPFSLELPEEGTRCKFYTCLVIRGEVPELYGFPEESYLEAFKALLGVPRLGPKTALNILAVFPPDALKEVVAEGDAKALSKVPGVGIKKAERLCLELKSKFKAKPKEPSPILGEALEALLNLGFSREEASDTLREVYETGDRIDRLLTKALRALSKRIRTHAGD